MPAPSREPLVLTLLEQQLQRWENLLRQQDEGGDADSPLFLPAAKPISAAAKTVPAPSGQPPAHWAKNLHSHEPPAHWVEMVRQKAPGLLDGTQRGVIHLRRGSLPVQVQSELPGSQTDAGVASPLESVTTETEVIHVPSIDTQPQQRSIPDQTLTFSVSQASPKKSPDFPHNSRSHPQPLMVFTQGDSLNPPLAAENVQQQELTSPPDPALNFREANQTAQTVWTDPLRAESPPPPDLSINEAQPLNPPVQMGEIAPTISTYSFPRYDELPLVELPSGLETEPPPEPAVQQTTFDDSGQPDRFQYPGDQTATLQGAWPELPMIDTTAEANEDVFLHAWKRRDRLDREQRGMAWSEPLS